MKSRSLASQPASFRIEWDANDLSWPDSSYRSSNGSSSSGNRKAMAVSWFCYCYRRCCSCVGWAKFAIQNYCTTTTTTNATTIHIRTIAELLYSISVVFNGSTGGFCVQESLVNFCVQFSFSPSLCESSLLLPIEFNGIAIQFSSALTIELSTELCVIEALGGEEDSVSSQKQTCRTYVWLHII